MSDTRAPPTTGSRSSSGEMVTRPVPRITTCRTPIWCQR